MLSASSVSSNRNTYLQVPSSPPESETLEIEPNNLCFIKLWATDWQRTPPGNSRALSRSSLQCHVLPYRLWFLLLQVLLSSTSAQQDHRTLLVLLCSALLLKNYTQRSTESHGVHLMDFPCLWDYSLMLPCVCPVESSCFIYFVQFTVTYSGRNIPKTVILPWPETGVLFHYHWLFTKNFWKLLVVIIWILGWYYLYWEEFSFIPTGIWRC